MQLKSTCKRIDNIPTKIVTQDIPQETLIEGKIQPPKKSITMYYLEKISLQYNHGSLQIYIHNRVIHVNKHEYTHPMPCFQPSQMLPCLTCQALSMLPCLTYQALSHSTLSFLPSYSHTFTLTTTLMATYIVTSPTKPPSGIT